MSKIYKDLLKEEDRQLFISVQGSNLFFELKNDEEKTISSFLIDYNFILKVLMDIYVDSTVVYKGNLMEVFLEQ